MIDLCGCDSTFATWAKRSHGIDSQYGVGISVINRGWCGSGIGGLLTMTQRVCGKILCTNGIACALGRWDINNVMCTHTEEWKSFSREKGICGDRRGKLYGKHFGQFLIILLFTALVIDKFNVLKVHARALQ